MKHGFDMQGVDYFPLNDLPPLSEDRILASQLKHLFELTKAKFAEVYFD